MFCFVFQFKVKSGSEFPLGIVSKSSYISSDCSSFPTHPVPMPPGHLGRPPWPAWLSFFLLLNRAVSLLILRHTPGTAAPCTVLGSHLFRVPAFSQVSMDVDPDLHHLLDSNPGRSPLHRSLET